MSNSSMIGSESGSVWCYIGFTLHAENVLFYVKDTFEIFFLCEFSGILTKLTEFYHFLIALGFTCSYFRLKRCF